MITAYLDDQNAILMAWQSADSGKQQFHFGLLSLDAAAQREMGAMQWFTVDESRDVEWEDIEAMGLAMGIEIPRQALHWCNERLLS